MAHRFERRFRVRGAGPVRSPVAVILLFAATGLSSSAPLVLLLILYNIGFSLAAIPILWGLMTASRLYLVRRPRPEPAAASVRVIATLLPTFARHVSRPRYPWRACRGFEFQSIAGFVDVDFVGAEQRLHRQHLNSEIGQSWTAEPILVTTT